MWTYFNASYSVRYTWMCPATLGFYDLFPGHPIPANRVYALPPSEHWGGVEASGGCCTRGAGGARVHRRRFVACVDFGREYDLKPGQKFEESELEE